MFLKPFKTIVVGVDFSEYSKLVVEQALLLATRWKTKIVLVHASHEPFKLFSLSSFSSRKPPSVSSLKERIRIFYKLKKKPIKIVVGYDTPAQLIRAVARDLSRPLIMAGYTGHSELAAVLLGSTARHLALGTNTPVWIHRGKKVVEPNRILVPHDLTRQSHHAIDLCKNLSLLSPHKYDVFFVRRRPVPVLDYSLYQNLEHEQVLKAQAGIAHLLDEYPRLVFHSTTGDVTEKIVEKTKDFDLILLTHRKQSRFLSRSETSELMASTQTPLLII